MISPAIGYQKQLAQSQAKRINGVQCSRFAVPAGSAPGVVSSALLRGDTTPGQAMRLVVHHKISLTQDLPIAYEQKIEQNPGVRAVTRLRWFGGTYKDPGDPKNGSRSLPSSRRNCSTLVPNSESRIGTSRPSLRRRGHASPQKRWPTSWDGNRGRGSLSQELCCP